MIDAIITVRQPWASAIFEIGKDVENRTWPTNFRGRLWIHAASKLGLASASPGSIKTLLRMPPLSESDYRLLPRGAILGHVTLTDVVRTSRSPWAMRGQYHWLIEKPKRLRKPVPYVGRQSLTLVERSALPV